MKISIYTGVTIEDKCRQQLHPLTEVKKAKHLLDTAGGDLKFYSNSPDFVEMTTMYSEQFGYEVELFVDGVSVGDNLDTVFADFNLSYSFMHKIIYNEE